MERLVHGIEEGPTREGEACQGPRLAGGSLAFPILTLDAFKTCSRRFQPVIRTLKALKALKAAATGSKTSEVVGGLGSFSVK